MSERRRTFELKKSLLRRAFDEGRGPEMILLILWRNAANAHACAGIAEKIFAFEEQNYGQPRGVRMLNVLAALDGSEARYSSTDVPKVHQAPEAIQ